MRVAYLGFDTLLPALDTVLAQGHTVLKVFTCPCDNVTEFNTQTAALAARHGIPCTVQRLTEADLHWLQAQGCGLLLCAGYYYRIPVTDAFPMVNVHPAPLPEARGAWPMPVLLLSGARQGGVTLHKMTRDFDAGAVVSERRFALDPADTLADYMDKVYAVLPDMVRALLAELPACLAAARPQGAGQTLPAPTPETWTVTAAMTVAEADRVLRAFYGYECLYKNGAHTWELIGARAAARRRAADDLPLRDGWVGAPRRREL